MDQNEKGNRGNNNRNRDRRNRDGRQEPRFKDIDITSGGGRPARVTGRDTQTGQKVQGRVDIRNPKGEIILNQTNSPRQNENQTDKVTIRPDELITTQHGTSATPETPSQATTTEPYIKMEPQATSVSQDPNKTRPLSVDELRTPGYKVTEQPIILDPNGRSIKSTDSNPGFRVTEKPTITDQFGRPIESTNTPTNTTPVNEVQPAPQPEAQPEPQPEAQPEPQPEAQPEPQPEAQPSTKPGYVSPYETPEQREVRIRQTREEIGGINQLNPDGSNRESNREDFNNAAFAYRDPNSQRNTPGNTEPTVPPAPTVTPVAETPTENIAAVTTGRDAVTNEQIKQTVLPGFDLKSFPQEKIPGGPDIKNNERFDTVGRDPEGKIIQQGNMFSLGGEAEPTTSPTTPQAENPSEPLGPFVIDTIIQQGTQSELYSAKIEQVRNYGDEIEEAYLGSYVNYHTNRERFINFVRNIPRAIRMGMDRARGEIERSRDLASKGSLDVIFGDRSITEARRLQDQIAEEGAALLANDLVTAEASKFEKVYASLDGKPEFEAAKKELAELIKKYSIKNAAGNYLSREEFEKDKAPIVERIMALAPESADAESLKDTIDGFWINIEKLRAQNLSAEKITNMEIVLNIKIARASFLRQTEVQRNLSNNLAERLRNTRLPNWLPARYRDVISIAIPAGAAMLGRMAASPIAGFITFGVAPLASTLISGGIEYKRKFDETDTSRRILARSMAGGGDPREALQRYNPENIVSSVNQVNIETLISDLNFALQDLETVSANPEENNQKVKILLDQLARYMALTDLSTKDKFDYFTASSEQKLIESKANAAQLALQIRNRINDLKTAGSITADINLEFKDRFQKATEKQTNSAKINSELFEAARGRLSTTSARNKGVQAGISSLVGGFIGSGIGGGVRYLYDYAGGDKILDQLSDSLVRNVVEPTSEAYRDLVGRMGLDINISPRDLLLDLRNTFPAGYVPDFAQTEFSGVPYSAEIKEISSNAALSADQLKGWLYETMFGTNEVHHGATLDTCDPTESFVQNDITRNLTPQEILENPGKYPSQFSELIQKGSHSFNGEGVTKLVEINGGEAWDTLLNQSEVVDKSQLFSISEAPDQVEVMGTLTHSYWESSDRDILNITGRDFVKGNDGGFLSHTMKTLEDGRVIQVREILPFNDFLSQKLSEGKFDVMVYLKDGSVVEVPAEYITLTDNGVTVDFKKVPGIIGEIWKSGNLGLAENIRYGFTTDTGSHALVSTIDINGPADDLKIIQEQWIPETVANKFTTTETFFEKVTKDCPAPDPIATPEMTPIPVILFGPGASGKEQRYRFEGRVNPANGEIINERKLSIDTQKQKSVMLQPTELLSKSKTPDYKDDSLITGNLGVRDTLGKASVQAAAILELLNLNNPQFNSDIMDMRSMLITNLDTLKAKLERMISSDSSKYGFLRKDLNHIETILIALRNVKVNSQYARDSFQLNLQQFVKQYLGSFYSNPTIQVPKVDTANQGTVNNVNNTQQTSPSVRPIPTQPNNSERLQPTPQQGEVEEQTQSQRVEVLETELKPLFDLEAKIEKLLEDLNNQTDDDDSSELVKTFLRDSVTIKDKITDPELIKHFNKALKLVELSRDTETNLTKMSVKAALNYVKAILKQQSLKKKYQE